MELSDIPNLKLLWKKVFGDENWYIDLFFKDLFTDGVIIEQDGKIAAMGFLVPLGTLNGKPCSVTYAVACDPDYRSNGYGGMISRELYSISGEGGVICPAEPSLFDYYANRTDYKTQFFANEYVFDGATNTQGKLVPVSAEEYIKIREQQLVNISHVTFDKRAIEHQKHICEHTGGDLFRIELGEIIGCCSVEQWGDIAAVKELLIEKDYENAASSTISAVFPDKKCIIRTPAKSVESAKPFAMGKLGFSENAPLPWFGFAFD